MNLVYIFIKLKTAYDFGLLLKFKHELIRPDVAGGRPTAGPTASDVKGQEVKDNLKRFDLVDIDDNVVGSEERCVGRECRSRWLWLQSEINITFIKRGRTNHVYVKYRSHCTI